MSDQILQDQLDFYGRLLADGFLADVEILMESKGVTENDIDQALSTLNSRTGKIGACIVVLQPTLAPDAPDAPGPRHSIFQTVQVIEQPLFNLGDNGTGLPASSLAERVRMLLHHFFGGRGATYTFAGQEPAPVDEGKVSSLVKFKRLADDPAPVRAAQPVITATAATAPATVTLACSTPGASITYSLDGSYPTLPYASPFEVTAAATIRAAATAAGFQQSNLRQLTLS